MLNLLIADDHLLFMEGLVLVLRDKFPGCQIHQASHLEAVKNQLQHHTAIDLLLLDRTMPGVDNLQHLQELWAIMPELRIAILSAADSPQHVREALALGVVGFISKAFSPDEMAVAIQHMLAGGIFVPEKLWATPPANGNGGQKLLSPRLLEVLHLAANGSSNKQIANTLGITEGTVKLHFHAILKVLEASNRTQAIQKARLLGLIS